jgi:hypothetical protein
MLPPLQHFERAGLSPGAQGKAIAVEQTVGQLRLPIATANEDGHGWVVDIDLGEVL